MDDRRDKHSPPSSGAAAEPSPAAAAARPPRERGSFGAWLRTQREARGVTLQAVVEASKISLRYLEALEGDRFDILPAPVFVRGFLREYARIVGLDGDEVVNFYLLAQPSGGERAAESRLAPPRGERAPSRRGSLLGYGALLVALLAVFVGVAMAISWWAGRRVERAIAPTAAGPTAAEIVAPSSQAATPPVAPRSSPEVAPPTALEPATMLSPSAPPPPPDGAAAPPALLRVVLEFQQDCWVEVVVDGRRRESELKAGGETLALEAKEYVSLTLGNAPAVRVEVNGRSFPLTSEGSRVVRDLRIDRAALAPPGATADATPRL